MPSLTSSLVHPPLYGDPSLHTARSLLRSATALSEKLPPTWLSIVSATHLSEAKTKEKADCIAIKTACLSLMATAKKLLPQDPSAWRIEPISDVETLSREFQESLQPFHANRTRLSLSPVSERVKGYLTELDSLYKQVCREVLSYMVGPGPRGEPRSICDYKAQKWAQAGGESPQYGHVTGPERDIRSQIEKNPFAGPSACGDVFTNSRWTFSSLAPNDAAPCKCWDPIDGETSGEGIRRIRSQGSAVANFGRGPPGC